MEETKASEEKKNKIETEKKPEQKPEPKEHAKKPKKSGYQSLHLIVEVPVVYGDKTQNVRVEIQIRSVAMDYWAELDTQMCYKKDAGQLEAVEKATREYADVIAGVDKKMLELRKKIQKM